MKPNQAPPGTSLAFRRPFSNTQLWAGLWLALVSILRLGHLFRGVVGALLAFSAQVTALLVVILLVRRDSRIGLGFTGFKWFWWVISIAGGLILGGGLALVNRFLLPYAWDWILAMDRSLVPEAWKTALPFGLTEVGLAIIGGILTPLAEEFFFRGLLMSAWRDRSGPTVSLFLQAAIFALLHLAHAGIEIRPAFYVNVGLAANIVIATFVGGVIFGWIRLRSGSIWPSVLAHAAVNLAAALL